MKEFASLFPLLTLTYCLIDVGIYLKFKIRLTPSFFFRPLSFLSSIQIKDLLFLILGVAALEFLLLQLPAIALWILFGLSLFNFRQKKLQATFPLSFKPPRGERLFEIDTKDQPHLIFLYLESFRAKNVGCLGAKEPLSPYFDRLASQGILFSQFHATGNLTNRCLIASLFGTPPAHLPCHMGAYSHLPLIGLPQILHQQGYHPALIMGGSIGFDGGAEFFQKQGFKTVLGKRDIGAAGTSWGVFDEHLMPFATSWLADQKKPAFLNLITITNHHPWITPPTWPSKHEEPFLNTFAYTDWCLHLLIEDLKQKGLLEKSILFIFGDHGQELADRTPEFIFNRHLYQENVHVPLLIYAQGRITRPQIIDTVASQIDLLPTVLDLLDISAPHHSFGKSLRRPSTAPIFFSQPFGDSIRGCRKNQWKYLLHKEKEELYDLSVDPEETQNLAGKEPSLKKETLAHFSALETFYSEKKTSSESSAPFHLDLSNTLTTDKNLEQIGQTHPDLASISLANCLLVTDQGIATLLKQCPKLEKLDIEGIDEITGRGWNIPSYLIHLKALNCPLLQIDWISNLPSLQILQFGGGSVSSEDLIHFSKKQTSLIHLHLSNIKGLTSEGLDSIRQANPQLQELWVDRVKFHL